MKVPRPIYLKVKHFYNDDETYLYDRVNDCPMKVSHASNDDEIYLYDRVITNHTLQNQGNWEIEIWKRSENTQK